MDVSWQSLISSGSLGGTLFDSWIVFCDLFQDCRYIFLQPVQNFRFFPALDEPEDPNSPPLELLPNVELAPPKGFLFAISEGAVLPRPPKNPPLVEEPPNTDPDVL